MSSVLQFAASRYILGKQMNIFIAAHPGLGDHTLCNGIYRKIAEMYEKVWIGVSKSNIKSVKLMLQDLKNVELITFGPSFIHVTAQRIFAAKIRENKGIEFLGLGYYGDNFMKDCRYDESFYRQAGIDFDERWNNFYFPRSIERQNQVFSELVGSENTDYLFVHEDVKRNMYIDRKYFGKNLRIVRPTLDVRKFSIFDYESVLKQAREIHCIESSFAVLVESLEISGEKFAHRYARDEAKNDWRLEFSYRSNWQIFT